MPEGALKSRSSEKLVPRVVSRRAVSPQTCAPPQASYHDHYAEDLIYVAVRPLTKLVFLIGDHINYHLSHHFNRKTSYSKVLRKKVCHPRFMPDRRCHQVGSISEDSISLFDSLIGFGRQEMVTVVSLDWWTTEILSAASVQ